MTSTQAAGTFRVSRTVAAPIGAVWRAWTDPALVRAWWGPDGWSCPRADVRFAEGASSVVTMRGPDGTEISSLWSYRLIRPQERIEFDSRFCDADGTPVSPAAAGLPPAVPDVVPHVVTLAPQGDSRTLLVVEESGYQPGPVLEMSRQGQEQCLDKLVAAVEGS
ncbi:SRPBCC domain-containing protein [Blastococcus sp. TF02A-30]|uniref:SRPBCC family protein n=1 Tax=Blastococcus sp. TF02A-30 TaxID=2250580 RepID=UPI0013141ED6|nr:SRPBCC domain-containing protein [Blastococcus sp. TF02A-30]